MAYCARTASRNNLRSFPYRPLNFMPSLSYPYSFQCKECGEQMTVTRVDARRAHDGPDSHNALKAVLKERGWAQAFGGMFCPDCAGEDV